MSYIKLQTAKDWMLVMHDQDDGVVSSCVEAAERWAADYMNRPGIFDDQDWRPAVVADDCESESEPVPQTVPQSVVVAILLMATDYYTQRVQTVVGTITSKQPAAEHMLHMYRKGLGV